MDHPPSDALRRLAAVADQLPGRPWRPGPLTAAQVGAVDEYDPDVDPDRARWQEAADRRARRDVADGLTAADGTPVVWAMRAGHDPAAVAWRRLADLANTIDDALRDARDLYRLATAASTADDPTPARPVSRPDVDACVQAAWAAEPTNPPWGQLTSGERGRFTRQVVAALRAAGCETA